MSDNQLPADEYIETLTGFEEIAIAKVFGHKPLELGDVDKMGLLRALYFVEQMRDGLKHDEAKKAALSATIKEVGDFFPDDDEDEETDPEDPITESGKDEPEPQQTPSGSQSSASEPASSLPSTTP